MVASRDTGRLQMLNRTDLLQALRLARREMRSGLRGFGVFLTCLFLGVLAISAIGSFSASAKDGLLADAGALLGGDLEIRLYHRQLNDEQRSFLTDQGTLSHVLTMRTMAAGPEGEYRQLVELKAVDDRYPLYGRIGTNPSLPLDQALAEGPDGFGALVEKSLLDRLQVDIGDQLAVGEGLFVIRGVITNEPDRRIQAFNLGPRLMVSQAGLATTGLVQPGSLVRHAYRLRMPDRTRVDGLEEQLVQRFPDAGWRVRTWREAAPRVRFFLDRMNLNLTLIGLCALLVGGLGVSGAVRGYLTKKVMHIATMKCLGASARLIFSAYLLQVLALGALGALLGLACGAAVPYLVAALAGERLPIPLAPGVHLEVLATAALFGLLIALAFSLHPLGVARQVSPAVLFRGYGQASGRHPGRRVGMAIGLAVLALALLAILTSSDKRLAFWFICGAVGCFGLFRGAADLLVRQASRLPRPAIPSLRLALGNIYRQRRSSGNALFSLGLGLTALVIVVSVQANLDDMVTRTVPEDAPAFFLLDIQPGQVPAFEAAIENLPEVTKFERYPTLRGRITAIAGVPVGQASIAPDVEWAVRGDRFLSYAGKMPPDNELEAGSWWPEDYQGPPRLSLTADLGEGFGVVVGDTLTVNILGREITAEIASLRQVDWSTLDLNFALLFAPGALEDAPQTNIASIHVPAAAEEHVYRSITRQFPNVSVISTREVLGNVARTLQRIGAAFRGMAGIALLTGFLVLAGAISADQHRRIHDAVIFKVCGATRRNILAALGAEFLLLGLAAGLLSALVGSLAAFGIVEGLMDMSYSLHPGIVASTVLIGIALTLLLGLVGTWKALGQKPAAYLRRE